MSIIRHRAMFLFCKRSVNCICYFLFSFQQFRQDATVNPVEKVSYPNIVIYKFPKDIDISQMIVNTNGV